jgi:hypothetical protein
LARARNWDRSRERRRGRSLSLDRGRSRERERERGRDRDDELWDREHIRPISPSRPRSGVRIVRPADGYTRPRFGMDRAGLERDMERLRLADDGEVRYGAERVRGAGAPFASGRDRTLDGRRERESDYYWETRAEKQMLRGERDGLGRARRDSGVDVDTLPLAGSNPFAPRPGLARRTGTGTGTGTGTYGGYSSRPGRDDFLTL